jgi:23S rRNA U2552 (ribose-2'-O)-methylase RlmE/FtsJ
MFDIQMKYDKYIRKLSFSKHLLSTLDGKKWSFIKNKLDCMKDVRSRVKNITGDPMVTNAWLKMHEMLHTFPILPVTKDVKEIKAFYACEAPGAFIAATNAFIAINIPHANFNWHAQSLKNLGDPSNPTGILGDTYGLMSLYPNRWLFGKDNTGDIRNIENRKYYASLEKVDVSFSDCGVASHGNEEKDLGITAVCQISTLVSVLVKGGSCIFKMFLPNSSLPIIQAINIVEKCFDTVIVFKPISSRPLNSEIYFICIGLKNMSCHNEIETIIEKYESKHSDPIDIHLNIYPSYVDIMITLIKTQIDEINKSIIGYEYTDNIVYHENELDKYKEKIINEWFERYPVKPLPVNKMLVW